MNWGVRIPTSWIKTKWAEYGSSWDIKASSLSLFPREHEIQYEGQRTNGPPHLQPATRRTCQSTVSNGINRMNNGPTTAAIQGCPVGPGSVTIASRGHAPTKLHNCGVLQGIQSTSPGHSMGQVSIEMKVFDAFVATAVSEERQF